MERNVIHLKKENSNKYSFGYLLLFFFLSLEMHNFKLLMTMKINFSKLIYLRMTMSYREEGTIGSFLSMFTLKSHSLKVTLFLK